MCGSVKDVNVVIYSLKKQLEVLKGAMDQLLCEVRVGLEWVRSKEYLSPSKPL